MQTNLSRLNALVDVVDSGDRVIATLPRRQLLSTGVNFRVAHVFLFDSRGRLLLQRIAPGLRHEAMWGSSVAGYVHAGESYDQAAIRKLRNELGISSWLKLIGKTSMVDNSSTKFIALYQGVHDGSLFPDPNQISDIRFESLHTIISERQSGTRAFTPTFLHLLDYYVGVTRVP